MFIKYLISCIVIIGLGTFLFIRGGKDKSSFDSVSGKVTYLNKTFKELPNSDFGKYRYLQIDKFSKTIELFIGKESGDFKPDLEKVDDLKTGNLITVYYDTDFKEENDGISRLVYFIDRGTEPVFIKGNWDKWLGAVVAGIGLITMIALILLKHNHKID